MSDITGNILNPTITRAALRLSLNNRNTGLEVFELTHITLGDTGFAVTGDETAIPGEKMRATIADATRVQFNTVMLRALFADKELPGFWVRSVGFWAGDMLFAVWSHPTETLLFKSPKSDLVFSHHLELAQIPPEQITVNVNREAAEGLNLSLTPYMAAMAAAQIDAMLRDVDHQDRIEVLETQGRSHGGRLDVAEADIRDLKAVDRATRSDLDAARAEMLQNAKIAAWQSEAHAEIMRGMGHSGLYQVRSYTTGGATSFARPWTEGFNPANIHNHPNYDGMPGTAEFSAVVNGYYLRTRHNDYRLRRPADAGSAFLETVSVDAPALPAAVTSAGSVPNQIAAMRNLFSQYQEGKWPAGFGWTLSYVEFWFEPLSGTSRETFDSFRHQDRASGVDAVLREVMKFNAGGYKDRFENIRFEAPVVRWIDANGLPTYGRLRYRMAAVDVSHLGDLRKWLEPFDDPMLRQGARRESGRFQLLGKDGSPDILDSLMTAIPGLDGAGASLEEEYGEYALANTLLKADRSGPLNAAYYSRYYAGFLNDAVNRKNHRRGFNDPMLFAAATSRPEVHGMAIDGKDYRFSWAVPFELILRTPLESWNPYGIEEVARVTGNGLEATPYSGYNRNNFFHRVPSEFYGNVVQFSDAADTRNQAWMRLPDQSVRQCRASGIYIALPSINGVAGTVRLRYPIYPVFHEGSHAYAMVQALRREQAEATSALATVQMDILQRQVGFADQAVLNHQLMLDAVHQARGDAKARDDDIAATVATLAAVAMDAMVRESGGEPLESEIYTRPPMPDHQE